MWWAQGRFACLFMQRSDDHDNTHDRGNHQAGSCNQERQISPLVKVLRYRPRTFLFVFRVLYSSYNLK